MSPAAFFNGDRVTESDPVLFSCSLCNIIIISSAGTATPGIDLDRTQLQKHKRGSAARTMFVVNFFFMNSQKILNVLLGFVFYASRTQPTENGFYTY